MVRTFAFAGLWIMYAGASGAGLMMISKWAKLVELEAGLTIGAVLVAVLAVGNGGGRLLAGVISDRIGTKATLIGVFLLQALLIAILSQVRPGAALAHPAVMAALSAGIGEPMGRISRFFPPSRDPGSGSNISAPTMACCLRPGGSAGLCSPSSRVRCSTGRIATRSPTTPASGCCCSQP